MLQKLVWAHFRENFLYPFHILYVVEIQDVNVGGQNLKVLKKETIQDMWGFTKVFVTYL